MRNRFIPIFSKFQSFSPGKCCLALLFLLGSCSTMQKAGKIASTSLLNDPEIATAHCGISLYDPEKKKFIYDYQGDKYFVPASNTKIVTLYAGLKYIRDSIIGLRYDEGKDTVFVQPTGDPCFLHPDFREQPVFDFLKKTSKPIAVNADNWKEEPWGKGWMWDDYNDDYMAERSPFPIYGNLIKWIEVRDSSSISALANKEAFVYSEPDINWKVNFVNDDSSHVFSVKRALVENQFTICQGKEADARISVPFLTHGMQSALELLPDTLGKGLVPSTSKHNYQSIIHSQLADSLFRIMMYRSDNFFAEQILLMVANEKMKLMNDARIIGDLLHNDLKEFPNPPNWVDGSGLSRYNLFSPRDFVWVLDKMQSEFGMERLRNLFPRVRTEAASDRTGDSCLIYAKSGSMSGVLCLSGFLYTRKLHQLVFSIMINNHQGSPRSIRKKMEQFLTQISDLY